MNNVSISRTPGNGPRTYSINDLVIELNVGRTLIYQLIKEGRLKNIKIGNRTLVTAEDLDAFISSLRAA